MLTVERDLTDLIRLPHEANAWILPVCRKSQLMCIIRIRLDVLEGCE